MTTNEALTEVSEAAATVRKLYELGWVQDQSPSRHFGEFWSNIKNLAENLTNLARVVENARLLYQQQALRSPNFRGISAQKDWDLSTMFEIVGRFRVTIDECEKLLTQNFVNNNEWALVVKPKVEDLQKRVREHNSKISILLKPLEIWLLAGIRHEFGNQPQDSFALLALPIRGLLVLDVEQAEADYAGQQPIPLDIPPEIEIKIRTAVEQSRPSGGGGLPLQYGVETFINYFEQGTNGYTAGTFLNERTPSAKQYINNLKCLLVLKRLQTSDELKRADQNSLWPVYIAELAEILRAECQRFATSSPQRLIAPDLASLTGELDQGDYSKWKREEIPNLMSPHFNTNMEEVFRVFLPSPQESLLRELSISRIDSTKLRLVESVASREAPSNRLGEISLDIDVKIVQLTPIYATPTSRPKPLEVLVHTGTSQLQPCFMEPKHVLRLQHLLTGYKVYNRYDQAMVKVSFFIAGRSTPLEEHGRIQLWLPQPFSPVKKAATAASISPQQGSPPVASSSVAIAASSPNSVAPSNRSGSIRKWIRGFKHNPGAAADLSNGSNRGSNISGSSSHPAFASSVATASSSGINFRSTAENAQRVTLGSAAPARSGPFELPADGLAALTGCRSSDTPEQLTSNGHPSLSPSNVSPVLQLPPSICSTGPSLLSSGNAVPQSPSNHVPYSPASLSPQDVSASTSRHPPPTHSSNYAPVLPSRSSRVTPTVMSSMSTRSTSSLAPTVSTIKTSKANSLTGGSGIARLHHKPQKPLLVIFLKSRDGLGKLALVAIQIDNYTSVKRERCECYSSHSSCRISCLEQEKGGSLLAQRWDADDGLAWDLAKLGEWQRKEGENVWSNLRRVSIKFEKMEDRYKFAGSPCSCNVKTTHELSRCNLDSHNGLFGIVKQIGDQMLQNYHHERDQAGARTMVLGPLPEVEL